MSNKKILVVEDDFGLREALVDTLTLAGFECVEADSGEAALLQLKETDVDMVISDVQMGGMSGLNLLKNIKNSLRKTGDGFISKTSISDYKVFLLIKYGMVKKKLYYR